MIFKVVHDRIAKNVVEEKAKMSLSQGIFWATGQLLQGWFNINSLASPTLVPERYSAWALKRIDQ